MLSGLYWNGAVSTSHLPKNMVTTCAISWLWVPETHCCLIRIDVKVMYCPAHIIIQWFIVFKFSVNTHIPATVFTSHLHNPEPCGDCGLHNQQNTLQTLKFKGDYGNPAISGSIPLRILNPDKEVLQSFIFSCSSGFSFLDKISILHQLIPLSGLSHNLFQLLR